MKSILFSLLIVAVSAGLGCESSPDGPAGGRGDTYPAPLNDPQISVLSPDLLDWIAFQPAVVIDDGASPLTVQVPMRNLTSNRYLLEYRFLFYDENGLELPPTMSWRGPVNLLPRQVMRLRANAQTMDARTYRLEVRWSQ